jgi:glyoxylate/hydroxypyruvate reductase
MTLYIHTALSDQLRTIIREQLTDNQTVLFRDELAADDRRAAFGRADIVMGNVPPAWLTAGLPALRWWQLDSAGFEQYRASWLRCAVTNMGDAYAWPCAETTVAGLLALCRQVPELVRQQARQHWVGHALRPRMTLLGHKHVVILGMGTIGQAVAGILTGFRCPVRFMARTNPAADIHGVEELKTALADADIVVNTLPGTAAGFFSAELIGAMRPGSLFANIGRGNTVDEPALLAALQSGAIGGAVLDVTATEPVPADSPLWILPNVLLTQHTGGGTADEEQTKVRVFLDNLTRFRAGDPLQNRVDLMAGY